ncbi:hypothetical protein [Marinicellulosiphila megalodicopiae]|uniref:hypothetical protein n=1 Tax=Marinicellulosiphila megalodicopiae TaxID=2724896 RepID=UPI003BB0E06A
MNILVKTIKQTSLKEFLGNMFIIFAENEMDERDLHKTPIKDKQCPLRKLLPTNPK